MPDPWIAIEATIRRSAKVTALPNDTARWGWIVALCEAKMLRKDGTFQPSQWPELMGRYARHRADYVHAGLLHVAPDGCGHARCIRGRGPFTDGTLVIHDWPVYQREHAVRQAEYRGRSDSESDAESDASSDVRSDSQSDVVSDIPSRALSLSTVYSPVSVTIPREPYQVGDDEPEYPVLAWLASRGVAIAPSGNGFHRKVVAMVEKYGPDRVKDAMAEAMAAGAKMDKAVVFGAANLLDPTPSGKPAPSVAKGMVQPIDEIREALRARND